jgi:hypothetical protein
MKLKKTSQILAIAVFSAVATDLTSPARADSITVPNFSFEEDGAGANAAGAGLTGWTGSNDGTFAPTVVTNGFAPEDGTYVAYTFGPGDGTATEISTTALDSLGNPYAILADTTYTLTVATGKDLSQTYNNGDAYDDANVALLANGVAITGATADVVETDNVAGTMTDVSVTFSSTALTGLVGETLGIQLGQDAVYPNGAYPNSDFDNVRLTSTADAVPEPSTWAMMFGGLAMLGFMLQRRQQVS